MISSQKDLTALIIDDCSDDRAIYKRFLSKGISNKIDFVETGNVHDAINAFVGNRFDFILLDYNLPDGSGFEFISTIKEKNLSSTIIMLTGVGNEKVAAKALNIGITDYLIKSDLTAETLIKTVQISIERNNTSELLLNEMREKEYLAMHDELTGLPNRRLFEDRLNQKIKELKRLQKGNIAILFIDLDGFKDINDTLGHSSGDKALIHIAERLTASLRENDTVCRMGGDEFLIILPDICSHKEIGIICKKIIKNISKPIALGDNVVSLTSSIGVSIYPADGDDVETLCSHADAAMYNAKANGKSQWTFFNENELVKQYLSNLNLNDFELFFQAKVSTKNMSIVGVEALLRKKDAAKGYITPDKFIREIEKNGLIVPVGYWVIEQACIKYQELRKKTPLKISINISTIQFKEPGFLNEFSNIIKKYSIPKGAIEVEITESFFVHDIDEVKNILTAFYEMGISVAIDDYGSGYASLIYLRDFNINTLKIDQNFIRNICLSKKDKVIVSNTIRMANELGLCVIAEGVETKEQLELLLNMRCSEIQGYIFSKPCKMLGDGADFLTNVNKKIKELNGYDLK